MKYKVTITRKVEDTLEVDAGSKSEAMTRAIGEIKTRNKLTSDFCIKEVEPVKKPS